MANNKVLAVFAVLFVASTFTVSDALHGRDLLQAASAPSPGEGGKAFDWGRPCTLLGATAESQITGPNNAACTPCGSGATATPEPTCTFKGIEVPVGSSISIFYHSSVHHLYLGDAACAFTTEICKNATSETISKTAPCTYTFSTAGSYFISDKAGAGGADDGEYCKDFGAALPVTVSSSS